MPSTGAWFDALHCKVTRGFSGEISQIIAHVERDLVAFPLLITNNRPSSRLVWIDASTFLAWDYTSIQRQPTPELRPQELRSTAKRIGTEFLQNVAP